MSSRRRFRRQPNRITDNRNEVTRSTPEAKRIIDFGEHGTIILNEEILWHILMQDDVKDKYVCVVSITGTYRQGKSFMLNLLLRYLNVKYKQKKDVTNWLHPEEDPISGFEWKYGSSRHTIGVLIWPEVFFAQTVNNEEVAIILLDTQGTFDNLTSVNECGTIFALSTILSSLQIYNLKEGIRSYDLEHLKCFSDYGQLLTEEYDSNGESSPFQKLLFLIRDWSYPDEYPYGTEGGKMYLHNELNMEQKQAEESKFLKDNVKSLYRELDCCLLPHPGSVVATSATFQGSLNDVDDQFRKHVQLLAPVLLAPKNLIIKTVNGEKIKARELFHLIGANYQHFRGGEIPPLRSMIEASAEIHYMVLINKCEALYENKMSFIRNNHFRSMAEEALSEEHQQAMDEVVLHFESRKKMGGEEMATRFKEVLLKKIEEKFADFQAYNELKKQNEERAIEEQRFYQQQKSMEQGQQRLEGALERIESELREERQRMLNLLETREGAESQSRTIRDTTNLVTSVGEVIRTGFIAYDSITNERRRRNRYPEIDFS